MLREGEVRGSEAERLGLEKRERRQRVEQLGEESLPRQVAPFDFRFKGEA